MSPIFTPVSDPTRSPVRDGGEKRGGDETAVIVNREGKRFYHPKFSKIGSKCH